MTNDEHTLLQHIEELVADEHRLHRQESMTPEQRAELERLGVELDQCWDLLRRRRALRMSGQDPDEAQVRPADVVEHYEQ